MLGRKANPNKHCRNAWKRPTRHELFFPFRALDLAGTEAAGALSLLLLSDSNNVDLEVVELNK
jgi:hypothetical protein